jgi:hypothetical protein
MIAVLGLGVGSTVAQPVFARSCYSIPAKFLERNPLGPCGSCIEWLKKIAEVNPDFKIITFTDSSCIFSNLFFFFFELFTSVQVLVYL